MKKLLIGAAAAAALLAPAVANAETNAVIGVNVGNTDFDGEDFDHYGLTGAFSHDFSNGWYVQMDGEHGRADLMGTDISTGYGAVHGGVRNDTYAFGGFVSFDEFFIASGTGYGIEGQYYLNNFVIGGSLGQVEFDGIGDFSATNLQLDAAYFITPNFAVNALLGTTDLEDADEEVTTWGAGAEYRFHGPLSISANWRNDEVDDFESDTWTIGLTFDLGTGSLHERQTQGPSLQGARNLNDALEGLPL
jgi:opacity protein-like surface antigen